MSFQTNAALVNAQAKLLAEYANPELRSVDNVTFRTLLEAKNIMFPSYEGLRTREDRPVDAKFVNRSARALGTARAHNHTGTVGTAGSLTPSWATKSDKFAISLKQADNNVFELEEMLMAELKNVWLNFDAGFETLAVNHIFSNRSGVNVATQEGTFDAVDDVFEINETNDGDRFMQIMVSNLHVNKYRNVPLDFYCDTVAFNKLEKQSAQGAGNSTNLNFQFTKGNNRFIHSVELGALGAGLVSAYSQGFVIAVPRGTVSALPWIPKQNRDGVEVPGIAKYGTLSNPADGAMYALHTYADRADGTATGGYTQDVVSEYEISLDVAFENAPLSTATESTLLAFALV